MLLIPACQGRDAHRVAVVVQLEINCRKNLAYFTTTCPNLGFQYCLGLSRASQAIQELVLEALACRQWRQSQMFHTTETLGSFHMLYEENSPEDSMCSARNVREGPSKVLRCWPATLVPPSLPSSRKSTPDPGQKQNYLVGL